MSTTEALRNGDGNSVTFNFPFEYLEESDVKVSVDGLVKTQDTDYTFSSLTEITFVTPPPSGTGNIRIFRETEIDNLRTQFFAGSAIRAQDLNENFNQTLYVTQEVSDRFIDRTQAVFQNNVDLSGNKIINLGDGTDATDAVNKGQLDATQNFNDSQLASKVSEATAQATTATTQATNASTSATNAANSASAAETSATNAAASATTASQQAAAAANSATAAQTFAVDPVFFGFKRFVLNDRTVLRCEYSAATDTTTLHDPNDFFYKNKVTSFLGSNGLINAQNEPKFSYQPNGHVYIQLH